ncbi:putative mediator of RNA polymerase II transcription subunit 8 [Amylocarpus encephaloides]|uniref:Mediator of RNA polymerase II transcription subunit 8 n=1 Tax=Amylocarpus encephaloides TaxID=45428 RepID=A0A9P7Y9Z4_9HELO|nr:putative mediator of RNA polymerase II transcription subunit 8 [Amylocarpus encephaloides]
MADVSLNSEDLKALEQTRQKLYQIANSIKSVKDNITQSPSLPPWSSLQASSAILAQSMQSLTTHLQRSSDVMNKLVVYPSTNYPGRTQENLLTQLLRKKLEPLVETMVEEARDVQKMDQDQGDGEDDEEIWDWATGWFSKRMGEYIELEMSDDYTMDERERGLANVNTGLRRKLDPRKPKASKDGEGDSEEEEDEEEEDEDEDMVGVGVAVTSVSARDLGQVDFGLGTLNHNPNGKARSEDDILRFATNGALVAPPAPPVRR